MWRVDSPQLADPCPADLLRTRSPEPRRNDPKTPFERRNDAAMTELTISSEEIRSAISSYVSSLESGTSRREVGIVADTGDGIAHVEGLPSAMTNELLEFEGGVRGVALNLEQNEIGAVVLGDYTGLEEGQQVTRTGEVLSVPVGEGYLGRVVDPLGNPIDGLGDVESDARRVLELQAAGVMDRQSVGEPLQTGIKAIDAMTPIGRGQRQLVIGDRKTGKTAVCVDTIINQKENWESGDPTKQVRCIYVAIGQKGSTIAGVRQSLEDAGALEYTTIVAAPASDPAGFKWLAPYTGSAIGQHWMYQGKHVLIVFDDLSKQAEAYRAISLLLRRPPGREAYPGDVFYLHSRLLERCAKLSDALGAGSMTGLPIIETKANDVSAYIPTNVISITDGQVFLESDLFNQGVRPAINVGISVSRVGGSAQIKAMKTVSGSLRLDLSQYRELEAFAAFGSDLDAASAAALGRGERLVELLKQAQYAPVSVQDQVVSIWLGTSGKLDSVPVADVQRFEAEFREYSRRHASGALNEMTDTGKLSDDAVETLTKAVDEFKRNEFTASDGSSVVPKEKAEKALDEDDIEQETVTVKKN
ncbi:ATP synthase alpha chain [Pseudonocardia sp. Ae406_Ps2]|nr:ATP synthase alpha chain [Pseudonocardia sp. Ae331_Ps2]OLM05022.1 ATP synthase alpha chain [Pseudonocardia sp. Ae406_Ps2]OLM26594.1 ATP synthase alpha chain [Pseudonocardia sp. Ae706_Ps2]